MNIFQYPNQQEVLMKNNQRYINEQNVGKSCEFITYDKKGFFKGYKKGKILELIADTYKVSVSGTYKMVLISDCVSFFDFAQQLYLRRKYRLHLYQKDWNI